MKKNTFRIVSFIIFLFFFIPTSFAQLSSFTLNVAVTNETCTGNGGFQFSTSGTTAGATVSYAIYLLPNLATPLAVTNNSSFSGLNSGVYSVVATQTLGILSNSQQQNQVIQNFVTPLAYQVTGQPETCNDGTIQVNVTQGNPVSYQIISGPVIVPPQSSSFFTGLPSGTYNIRVNDACGDGLVQTYTVPQVPQVPYLVVGNFDKNCTLVNCTTSSGDFIVSAATGYSISYPLTVAFSLTPPGGGTPLTINQVVTSGGLTQQSISVNFPYYQGQVSYSITVTDSCGNSFTNTGNSFSMQMSLSLASNTDPSCNKQIVLSLCDYLPPYTVNFVSAPAGFNPAVYNLNHPGPFTTTEVSYAANSLNALPNGTYTISVTDACNRTVQGTVAVSDFGHQIEINATQPQCTPLTNVIDNVGGPNISSVIITVAPSTYGFTLPHDVSSNINNGGFSMNLPAGTYTFLITDVCGNTNTSTLIIPPRNTTAVTALGGNSPGCSLTSGFVNISISGSFLASIVITQAPLAYNQILPYDVSSSITSNNAVTASVTSLAPGGYTFNVTDFCGFVHVVTANVGQFISQGPLLVDYRRGCSDGFTSLTLYSPNGPLQNMIITAAPTTFGQTLPFNVSTNIASNGRFYMNSLPEGSYTLTSLDICGVARTTNLSVVGLSVSINSAVVQGNCGSFNLGLEYVSNLNNSAEFWLQKLNTVTGQWQHPITGAVYTNGSIPDGTNALQLNNLATQLNIASLGNFRILKSYFEYGNGSAALSNCVTTIKEFQFTGDLAIASVYAIPCSTTGTEVLINANGIAPLTFQITTKDGLPFLVNNGQNNVFSGLQPGIYNFQVSDLCGNIVNSLLDITSLPEPIITPQNLCAGQIGQLTVDSFPFFSYQWWKGTATTTILSTTNTLTFNPFSDTTSPGTYYVRIYAPNSVSCVDKIISFTIPPTVIPNAGNDGAIELCGNSNSVINLNTVLQGPYDATGIWQEVTNSGSALSGSNWNPQGVGYGVYTFKYSVSGTCTLVDEAIVTVTLNESPVLTSLTTNPILCEGDTIELEVASSISATYNWTGPNNFQSDLQNPIIQNSTVANNGDYTVTATSSDGCSVSQSISVQVESVPEFSITANCNLNQYLVEVVPENQSFTANEVSYQWSGPNGFSSTSNPLNLTGQERGVYTVVVTSSSGCSTSQFIDVVTTLCSIPKGVSANNDGENDTFNLSGFDVSNLKIFNRYGMVMYEKANYENEWYGQDYNGHLLPSATYYYLVTLESGEAKTGWVYVARD